MAANLSVSKPQLSEPFPDTPPIWRDPVTGLKVPKRLNENLRWRANLLERAERDEGFANELYTACGLSLLFWMNSFAWTFNIREVTTTGKMVQKRDERIHVPYITWRIQDEHLKEIERAIDEGYDLLTDKSREMGASWNHIAVLHHQWLFREDRLFLEISRVERDVDGHDNPKCLFVKHDYLNRWLPEWMRPPGCLPGESYRTQMHITNCINNSRIDGESSNKAAGSGDRRHAVLLDEFAKAENAEKIKAATADVAACRLVNSTPWGAGTAYTKWRKSGKIKVFVLPWWRHPEKGRGRFVEQDDITGKWKIRSPWYNVEEERRTRREMAQEIDMDHMGSGSMFFDAATVEAYKNMFGRKPRWSVAINFFKQVYQEMVPKVIRRKQLKLIEVRRSAARTFPWKLWVNLLNGRPDQSKTYIFGIDISKGQGASNSVMSVLCAETREKIAEFADANTPPYELAWLAAAAGVWFGGRSGLPLMIWEANGDPGITFGRVIVRDLEYPNYFIDKTTGVVSPKRAKQKKYGWHSSRDKKADLLGMYDKALALGGIVNHSIPALNETLDYIQFDDGSLGPASLSEESAAARLVHGDRVIADALTLLGVEDAPRGKFKGQGPTPTMRCLAYRIKLKRMQRRAAKKKDRFDFTHVA